MPPTTKAKPNGRPIVLEDVSDISIKGQVFPATVVDLWRVWAGVLIRLNNFLSMDAADGAKLTSLQLCEPKEGTGVLLVVKATIKKRAVKGFHRGDNIAAAVGSLMDRLQAGSLDWRDDLPYAQRTQDGSGSNPALSSPPPV